MNKKHLILCLMALFMAQSVAAIPAQPHECYAGDACTLGEFYFNNSWQPYTAQICEITIKMPDGTAYLTGVAMSNYSDGWHNYTLTLAAPQGLWRTLICCNSTGGDYACIDHSFTLTSAPLVEDSFPAIPYIPTSMVYPVWYTLIFIVVTFSIFIFKASKEYRLILYPIAGVLWLIVSSASANVSEIVVFGLSDYLLGTQYPFFVTLFSLFSLSMFIMFIFAMFDYFRTEAQEVVKDG